MTVIDHLRPIDHLQESRRLLTRMDLAPDGKIHDKKCWFCARCGDDLEAAIKELDKALDAMVSTYKPEAKS